MARSERLFERWERHDSTTWSARVFRKYNDELTLIWDAHVLSSQYTYTNLKNNGAKWNDLPSKHFNMNQVPWEKYSTLKIWSDSHNAFENWVNLSVLLTISSNLETYLSSVISTALESDPGVLLGASRSVDGAMVLKHGKIGVFHTLDYVTPCIKGEWSSRLDAFEKLFGVCIGFRSRHKELEEIRKTRNRFAHAFGREIDDARLPGKLDKEPMDKITVEKARTLSEVVYAIVFAVDQHLIREHIGDYEAVRFYHNLYPSLHKHVSRGQRAMYLKKGIGRFGAALRGKTYCNGLVNYWEDL